MTSAAPTTVQTPAPYPILTLEERNLILQRTIVLWARAGYAVVNQTATTAQLVRKKTFSCLWASLWFLLFGIGLVIYLFAYWGAQDEYAYLSVDPYGRISATRS